MPEQRRASSREIECDQIQVSGGAKKLEGGGGETGEEKCACVPTSPALGGQERERECVCVCVCLKPPPPLPVISSSSSPSLAPLSSPPPSNDFQSEAQNGPASRRSSRSRVCSFFSLLN